MKILIKDVFLDGNFQSILIEDNLITKISNNINEKVDDILDAKKEKAIIPGFINCHTHSAMILFRGLADDISLHNWLEKIIWPMEARLTEEDVYWGTKMAMIEMIESGTTTFNEMYLFREAQIRAIEEMGMRGFVGMVMFDFGSGSKKEDVENLYKKYNKKLSSTTQLTVAPHSIYTVESENLTWAADFAKKNNLLLHMHLSETKKEVEDCLAQKNILPVEYLEKIGFLGENCLLAHSVWLDKKEIEILSQFKTNLIYNPSSNMKLASGIFKYEDVEKSNINITLGTDGAASNNNLDLFSEMKIAALLPKVNTLNPTIAPAKNIFNTATKNAAFALKINSGEIKEGKIADLVLLDLNNTALIPNHNLVSNIVYSASNSCVTDTIINGKIIMRDKYIEEKNKIYKNFLKCVKKLNNI